MRSESKSSREANCNKKFILFSGKRGLLTRNSLAIKGMDNELNKIYVFLFNSPAQEYTSLRVSFWFRFL